MKPKIFVDAGHGGNDNGAAWGGKYDYVEEDDLNLIISYLLQYELLLTGTFDVKMSRTRDEYVSLQDRVKMANEWGATLFVSVHADAFHNETTKGISTHVYSNAGEKSATFGLSILTQLMREFPDHLNRGLKRSNFYVLRKTKMPAVLVEAEFLSNPDTRRFLHEPENQVCIARAIAYGIKNLYVK